MATEFRVIAVDTTEGTPDTTTLSLQTLREAVLAHPTLALQALKFALGSDAEIPGGEAGAFSGTMPLDIPIFKMLTPDQAALLSPKAKTLTKGDLLALQGSGAGDKMRELGLTFDDLKSVEEAFHQRFAVNGLEEMEAAMQTDTGDGGVSCCCCTPCCSCCAAAVAPAADQDAVVQVA
ncbi:hypothetical protein [Cryptosporangium aurantiacum]|uniref:Uncharacterized protein n=1 Tax=Cryptosporangium aurantiacum TaxID=134849 RepID=A0A1M7RGS0_9ACTN|nr:hypothetical protein [Cryptosporangium aurantiacum]SHN45406.1 hypothetical protein SAMN05443668_11229 [Cryptosporangium aurantiacum]